MALASLQAAVLATRGWLLRRWNGRLGRPVGECDPLVLEVHPAIQVPGAGSAGVLPGYVTRAHDRRLRETADRMFEDERSRLVTLVGGSSTGKTRACWELAHYLEQQQPGRWWLWHPYDPTRPDAVLADVDRVGPYTIVWLNEAQLYLAPPDQRLGERIAAGLRTLLQDQDRQPVLVLATLWPQYWSTLTTRPPVDQPDAYAQARDLMTGSLIDVPDRFTPDVIAGLQNAGVDPRLWQAAANAEAGRIAQYLAGAPELENRYRTATPAVRAIIDVAIDARRFGHPLALPHALLEMGASGYLDDHDWDHLNEDWLEAALADAAKLCKGARGPLTRIRPRPSDPASAAGQPYYRLADYLEQVGGTERAAIPPPDSLWIALATTVTDPDLLGQLGKYAEGRGHYEHAIRLYTQSADHGNTRVLWKLVDLVEWVGDTPGAETLLRQAADRGDVSALRDLAERRERAGDTAGAEALAVRAADLGNTMGLQQLARRRERAGDAVGAEARQAANRGDAEALRQLVQWRERAGDGAGAEALLRQAADHGDTIAVRQLVHRLVRAGDAAGAEALAVRAADRGDTVALRQLVRWRERAGDTAGAEALAVRAADGGDTVALRQLASRRERAGDTAGAEALLRQAADRGDADAATGYGDSG